MNYIFSNQETSSGCESGWTLYLDNSSINSYASYNHQDHEPRNRSFSKRLKGDETEYEEDLSMVSDASSGPQHFHEEESCDIGNENTNGCFYNYSENNHGRSLSRSNMKKTKENRCSKVKNHSSLLDDTASSPIFENSNKSSILTRSQPSRGKLMEEYSQGYSTTQFEVRPPYHEQYYDFSHFQ